MNRHPKQTRHPRAGGDPSVAIQWIPAFAGMTLRYGSLFVKTQKCGAKGPNLMGNQPD